MDRRWGTAALGCECHQHSKDRSQLGTAARACPGCEPPHAVRSAARLRDPRSRRQPHAGHSRLHRRHHDNRWHRVPLARMGQPGVADDGAPARSDGTRTHVGPSRTGAREPATTCLLWTSAVTVTRPRARLRNAHDFVEDTGAACGTARVLDRFVLMGLSMGGHNAIAYSAAHPHRVRAPSSLTSRQKWTPHARRNWDVISKPLAETGHGPPSILRRVALEAARAGNPTAPEENLRTAPLEPEPHGSMTDACC